MGEVRPAPNGLYIGEAEVSRRLGIPSKRWRALRGVLEANGMRRRDPLIGLRYWPAVKAFFDKRNGLDKMELWHDAETWGEDLDALKPKSRRTRADVTAQR